MCDGDWVGRGHEYTSDLSMSAGVPIDIFSLNLASITIKILNWKYFALHIFSILNDVIIYPSCIAHIDHVTSSTSFTV